jgi:rare lipoprotein A
MSVLSAVPVVACLCIIASTGARAEWIGGSKSNPSKVETWSEAGVASYYGTRRVGRRTASGAKFDKAAMTAAHAYLPFGTKVLVTLQGSGRAVVVTINDRLPTPTRVIDLSVGAARALGIIHSGVARVVLRPAGESEVGDHW